MIQTAFGFRNSEINCTPEQPFSGAVVYVPSTVYGGGGVKFTVPLNAFTSYGALRPKFGGGVIM